VDGGRCWVASVVVAGKRGGVAGQWAATRVGQNQNQNREVCMK